LIISDPSQTSLQDFADIVQMQFQTAKNNGDIPLNPFMVDIPTIPDDCLGLSALLAQI
jgi:hypothetical protein